MSPVQWYHNLGALVSLVSGDFVGLGTPLALFFFPFLFVLSYTNIMTDSMAE